MRSAPRRQVPLSRTSQRNYEPRNSYQEQRNFRDRGYNFATQSSNKLSSNNYNNYFLNSTKSHHSSVTFGDLLDSSSHPYSMSQFNQKRYLSNLGNEFDKEIKQKKERDKLFEAQSHNPSTTLFDSRNVVNFFSSGEEKKSITVQAPGEVDAKLDNETSSPDFNNLIKGINKDLLDLKQEVASQVKDVKDLLEKNSVQTESYNIVQQDQRDKMIEALKDIVEKLGANSKLEHDSLLAIRRSVQTVVQQLIISRSEHTSKLNDIVDAENEELKKLEKLDEASQSSLTTGAAWATILSVIIALLIFLYQSYAQNQKEEEQRAITLEKLRIKAEDVQKRIALAQKEFLALEIQANDLKEKIQKLEQRKDRLINEKEASFFFTRFFFGNSTNAKILEYQDNIEDSKSALRVIEKQITILMQTSQNEYKSEADFIAKQIEANKQHEDDPRLHDALHNSFGH